MKKLLMILILATAVLGSQAQGQRHQWQQQQKQSQQQPQQQFSPEMFEKQMQDYITKEAKLTEQEAAKLFPIYKEMQDKQRVLFGRQRELANVKPSDEEGCLKVIKESDEIDIELKRIQQTYHQRIIKMLSASKLYDVMKAEQHFRRSLMTNWGRGGQMQQPGRFNPFGQWPQQQQGQGRGWQRGQRHQR